RFSLDWSSDVCSSDLFANSGLPGTSGFVGEFMVILAAFQQHPLIALVAAITLVLGAAYTLWLVKRVMYGEVGNAHVAAMKDINRSEERRVGQEGVTGG